MIYYIEPQYVTGAFQHNGVNYPAGWLSNASAEQLAALGAVPQPEYDPTAQVVVPTHNPAAPFEVRSRPAPDLAALRDQALAEIDSAAGDARGRYITTVPGQETTPAEKEKEARAHADGASGPFPFLEAEAAELNSSVAALAAEMIATAEAWRPLGVAIEAKRRAGKVAVSAAADAAAIQAAKEAALAALKLI